MRRSAGFTLLEAVVGIAVVGLGVSAVLLSLSQGRRNQRLVRAWAEEESRATELLFERLGEWEQLRTDPGRRAALVQEGRDPRLGAWTWDLQPEQLLNGNTMALYKVRLRWQDERGQREGTTHAVLRVVP